MMPGGPMSRTETKGLSEREWQRQNRIPVIAHTKWKKLIHKFFPWALNRLLFLRMPYLRWMRIFKRWFNRLFLCSGMKIEFLLSTGIKYNNYLYCFGHKEKVDLFVCLFVCFALKCKRTSAFLIRLPNWFSLCLNSEKKILPLYSW